ncbi:RTA1 like protein-domain-containing protein [Obelidium mucronatum]|nr:RTA1 like protein-domain-containing protein [Obelidium mucronatum]
MSPYLADGSLNFALTPFGTKPKIELAYAGAVIFSIILFLHVGLAIRFKTRYMLAAIVGCTLEAAGYIARVIAINDPFATGKYSIQQAFIILGPTLIAATQYVMLEKIIHFSYPAASPIKHHLITRIFVISDIITFIVQCGGSVFLLLPNPTMDQVDLGTNILLAGIVMQMVSFVAYISLAIVFYNRALAIESGSAPEITASNIEVDKTAELVSNWKRIYFTLMFSGAAVCLRSGFRIVEFANGFTGPIATNENYMYVFDFLLMAVAMVAFVVVHPGSVLRHAADVGKIEPVVEGGESSPDGSSPVV